MKTEADGQREFLDMLAENRYTHVRLLGGRWVGLLNFNFTMGLVVGLTWEGHERRYCYEFAEDATEALDAWDGQDHPGGPWIKCKGAGIDLLNPNFGTRVGAASATAASTIKVMEVKPPFVHLISPSYTSAKIEPPFYRDLVDVFDDRMRGWLIEPAKQLLRSPNGYVAAVALATTYFEGIEHYVSGPEDKASSKVLFRRAFQAVFKLPESEPLRNAIADAMYQAVRCGFAHEALPGMGIYVADSRQAPILVTWPKKDGQFDPKAKLQSAIINPHHFIKGIETHLQGYVRLLRRKEPGVAKDKFLATVNARWGLESGPRYVGLGAEEFFTRAPTEKS